MNGYARRWVLREGAFYIKKNFLNRVNRTRNIHDAMIFQKKHAATAAAGVRFEIVPVRIIVEEI